MISLQPTTLSLLVLLFIQGLVEGRLGGSSTRNLQDQQLVVAGNNGQPADKFPLGLCEGDCDNDSECGEGLYCLQRQGGQQVPGCVGDLTSQTDYCVTMTTIGGTTESTSSAPPSSEGPSSGPTSEVSEEITPSPTIVTTEAASTTRAPTDGDTLATTTIDPTMMETTTMDPTTETPTTGAPTAASSASPSQAPEENLTVNVEVVPDEAYPLLTVGNDGSFQSYPLLLCHGDCDVDEDCTGDLVCFQRVMDETVPGCYGSGDFSIDYCVRPIGVINSIFDLPAGVAVSGALELAPIPLTEAPETDAPSGALEAIETEAPTATDTVGESSAETTDPTTNVMAASEPIGVAAGGALEAFDTEAPSAVDTMAESSTDTIDSTTTNVMSAFEYFEPMGVAAGGEHDLVANPETKVPMA